MAENVKRRVAAARMAVAFVAAGTIAGATAWAQASPAPPEPTAKSSTLKHFEKFHRPTITGADVVDGSLLYKDFKKFQVPSEAEFKHFQKVEIQRVYPKVEIDRDFIKLKDADARYIKLDDLGTKVVGGKGSVFTATRLLPTVNKVTLLDVPGKFTVDTTGPIVTITNHSGSPMTYTDCTGGGAGGGTVADDASFDCNASPVSRSVQLIGGDGSVATLNFSAVSVQGGTQSTVQILIGL